jgi:hypothetical protein
MLATQAPFPNYTGLDGGPLDTGKLYFGVANQEPTSHPISVFWDAAGLIPALQPIPTLNGYPVYNGTPAVVYVNAGDYSQSVYDSTGQLVSYSRSAALANNSLTFIASLAAPSGSSLINFVQAGVNAVTQPVQQKLRERVSLEDFGGIADWNGTTGTDNINAFNAAVTALATAGGTIELGPGAYAMTAPTLTGNKHVRIVGRGGSEAQNSTGASEIVLLGNASFKISSPRAILADFNVRGGPGHTVDGVVVGATAGANANSFHARGVGFFSAGQDGLRIGNDAGANCNSWHLDSCRFNNNGRFGFHVSDNASPTLPNANAGTWINCGAQGNVNDGVHVGNSTLNSFIGGYVESNGGAGMRLVGAGSNYNYIAGVDFDSGNTAGNLLIQAGAVANRVDCPTLLSTALTNAGTDTLSTLPSSTGGAGYVMNGVGRFIGGRSGGATDISSNISAGSYLRFVYGPAGFTDAAADMLLGSPGLTLGKAGGNVGFYGVTPAARATTAVASAAGVANSGTTLNFATTFDGYTLAQVVRALRLVGILA